MIRITVTVTIVKLFISFNIINDQIVFFLIFAKFVPLSAYKCHN